jgi:hypothetical protein
VSFPLYLDENMSPVVARLLIREGYDVMTARNAGLAQQGIADEVHLQFATSQGRALLTHDLDDYGLILEEWYVAGREHFGVIVTPQLIPAIVARRVLKMTTLYPSGIKNLFLFA